MLINRIVHSCSHVQSSFSKWQPHSKRRRYRTSECGAHHMKSKALSRRHLLTTSQLVSTTDRPVTTTIDDKYVACRRWTYWRTWQYDIYFVKLSIAGYDIQAVYAKLNDMCCTLMLIAIDVWRNTNFELTFNLNVIGKVARVPHEILAKELLISMLMACYNIIGFALWDFKCGCITIIVRALKSHLHYTGWVSHY